MLFGPGSKLQRFQNDSNEHKPTDADELFDIEYFPPTADNYWEDQSQYDLGLFAVRHMDVFPAASSSSVSESSHREGSPSGWENFHKEEFMGSVQSPELANNVGSAASNDIFCLLKRETFSWADDLEDSVEQEEEDHKNVSMFFVVDSLEQSNLSDPSSSLNAPFDTEAVQESSRLRDTDRNLDNEQQYLPKVHDQEVAVPTLIKYQLELLIEAINEVARQTDLISEYPNIHHFNWFGGAVMERSYTPPEVSLFVIASPPKPLHLERLLRQPVTLRQAMKFVDPILYCGCWNDLKNYSGQELFKAITGKAFRFYTSAGTWQHDIPDPGFQQPIVDPADPHIYARESKKGIPLNGWSSAYFAFTREKYLYQAHKPPELKPRGGSERQPFRRSPLHQCILADDAGDAPYDKEETSVVE
ncbi:hypothetical protein GX51_02863 [Blastomyces parvus]|uniref:Uncharacterized protein n=1 Tax=Blastomyces parvus TaxID=2060905 RepID=A0A2B7X981_9EURO|nr:hypothetical protein GX51_02863 [Blastomyces parvus]